MFKFFLYYPLLFLLGCGNSNYLTLDEKLTPDGTVKPFSIVAHPVAHPVAKIAQTEKLQEEPLEKEVEKPPVVTGVGVALYDIRIRDRRTEEIGQSISKHEDPIIVHRNNNGTVTFTKPKIKDNNIDNMVISNNNDDVIFSKVDGNDSYIKDVPLVIPDYPKIYYSTTQPTTWPQKNGIPITQPYTQPIKQVPIIKDKPVSSNSAGNKGDDIQGNDNKIVKIIWVLLIGILSVIGFACVLWLKNYFYPY